MRYFKFIVINIVVFAVFFLLFSFLFPSVVHTSKTINIGANKDKVVNALRTTLKWKSWNEFVRSDSVVVSLTRTNSDTVITDWRNNKDKKLRAIFTVINDHSDSTIVNWNLEEHIHWNEPWKKFAAVLAESKYGYAMEVSLAALKKEMEKDPH